MKPERKGLVKPFLALAMVATLLLNTLAFLPMHRAVATFPGLNGKIAFTSIRDGNDEIYAMNADGTDQTRLTNNPATDGSPTWSPDGTKIAFVSNRDGSWGIYVMNPDGSGVARLTKNPTFDRSLAWSPDGTKILFVSHRDGNDEIYVMNADGTDQTRLTNNPAGDWNPTWSPDGTRIAFNSNRESGQDEIYVMNPDGSGVTDLTNNPASDGSPTWSPDGTRIAFVSERDGQGAIFVMNADGTDQTRLTNNPAYDGFPTWSPDGTKIAFVRISDGSWEIYAMKADGSGVTRLTNNPAGDVSPAMTFVTWQPIPWASFDVQPRVTGLTIDDRQYSLDQMPLSFFQWTKGSTHSFEAPTVIQAGPGFRYVFKEWTDGESSARRTLTASPSVTFVARYEAEYSVSVSSPYGTSSGAGWYKAGANARLSIQGMIDHGNRTRRTFAGWYEDETLVSQQASITVNVTAPTTLVAHWNTEYRVDVSSDRGTTSGAGWYKAGETTNISVESTVDHGNGTRRVFAGWYKEGTLVGHQANTTVNVTAPMMVVARWNTEYRVDLSSDYATATGGGWFTIGSSCNVSVQNVVDHGNGTRRVLEGWYRDGLLLSPASTLSMEVLEPISLEVKWETEYLVSATTPVGHISGTAWYRRATNATVSVSTTRLEDLFTNYVFEGWKVAEVSVSTSPSYSFTVTGPISLAASWKTELNIVRVGAVAGVAILIIGAVVVFMLRRPKP